MAGCAFGGCQRPVRTKGLCNACYEYLRKHGTLVRRYQPGKRPIAPLRDRLLARIDQNGPLPPRRPDLGPCWLWKGFVGHKGYGYYQGQAHRTVWREFVGPLDPALQLDHLCFVKACVRPEHLEPVTPAENMRRQALARERCRNQHDLAEEGFKVVGGKRFCARCYRERFERFRARHAAY